MEFIKLNKAGEATSKSVDAFQWRGKPRGARNNEGNIVPDWFRAALAARTICPQGFGQLRMALPGQKEAKAIKGNYIVKDGDKIYPVKSNDFKTTYVAI